MTTLNEESLQLVQSKLFSCEELSFVVLGDSHLNTYGLNGHSMEYDLDENGERYKSILQHIVTHYGSSISFVIHGGDAIGEGIIDRVSKYKQKETNFQAFVSVTKDILFSKQIPIFVTIGNHDFLPTTDGMCSQLFEEHIGPVRGEIAFPGTSFAYLYLPTYFSETTGTPYFYKEDLHWMQQKLTTHCSDHYFIDFHAILRVGGYKQKPEQDHYVLSTEETASFFKHIRANVQGIANHHHHSAHEQTVYLRTKTGKHPIPYLLTGCGGNTTSRSHCPHYFIGKISGLQTENPQLTYTPVHVPGLF